MVKLHTESCGYLLGSRVYSGRKGFFGGQNLGLSLDARLDQLYFFFLFNQLEGSPASCLWRCALWLLGLVGACYKYCRQCRVLDGDDATVDAHCWMVYGDADAHINHGVRLM